MAEVLQLGLPVVFYGSAEPSATDDVATIGVRVGYIWMWQSAPNGARWWICEDNTESSAIWREIITGIRAREENGTVSLGQSDHGMALLATSGSPSWTLPDPTTVMSGWTFSAKARGTDITLLAPSGCTINGSSSEVILSGSAGKRVVILSSVALELF